MTINLRFTDAIAVGDGGSYDANAARRTEGGAILARIDYSRESQESFEVEANELVDVPEFENLVVILDGVILTPAEFPQEPGEKEYLYNPYTQQITVFRAGKLIISGNSPRIPIYPPLLPPPHPWIFTRLPLEGEISINRSFEQHPSADFSFETTLPRSQVLGVLFPGLEIDIYNIPLRISAVRAVELPRATHSEGRCRVDVSFSGKWENYLEEPCFLRSDGRNPDPGGRAFEDPDCLVGGGDSATKKAFVTILELLRRIGIPYLGLGLSPVEIPDSTPQDAITNPPQLLSERVRVAGGFEFWSNPSGMEVRMAGATRGWEYNERDILGEISASYDAISKQSKRRGIVPDINPPQPDLVNFPSLPISPPSPPLRSEANFNLYYEFKNAELTGAFQEEEDQPRERSQGQVPRWIKKSPTRTTRVEGDRDAHVPLEGVELVQVMSLCFDIGGQTKTRTFVTEENGTRVEEVEEIWGFAYTANEIYDDASKSLRGGLSTWKLLKQVLTRYTYDMNTGYLLYVNQDGFNTVRFLQENPETPETLRLPNGSPRLSLYEFIRIPVISRTSYALRLMPEWDSEGLFELDKQCNRDGTSTPVVVFNPNFAPPYYVEVERSESSSFARRSNPANENLGANAKRQPDLIVGEESRFQSITEIIPAVYNEKYTFDGGAIPAFTKGEVIQPQKYIKYVRKFKAQGAAIANALEEVFVEEQTGDPPLAQRRADQYYREEVPQDYQEVNEDDTYRYFLQTPGYTYQDPINGSESFPVAKTLEEALKGARTKLAIENWRQGFSETLQIPGNLAICEGDRFNYFCNGEYRRRVVLSVQHQIQIQGMVGSTVRSVCVTSLTLGRYIWPTFDWNRVRIPRTFVNTTVLNVINQQLGSVLDWMATVSRRRP